jgi:HNH endonuclease
MRCFFCLRERDPSDEHVFPKAIGGTVATGRVCKSCNDFLGAKVDVLLTNHPAILIKRGELGMMTRAGKAVDGFRQLFSEGSLAADPEKRIQLVLDKTTGKLVPKMKYHAKRTPLENGTENVEISLDENDIGRLETIVQRERKRAGQPPLPENEIAALILSAKQNMRKIDKPEVIYNTKVDISNYHRAICKIIYELACMWLGDDYIGDNIGTQLRHFVLDGTPTQVPALIEFRNDVPALSLWQNEPKAHIALAMQQHEDVVIAIRVFNAISAVVIVTKNAKRLRTIEGGRFLLIGLARNRSRRSTLDEEILRMTSQSQSGAAR